MPLRILPEHVLSSRAKRLLENGYALHGAYWHDVFGQPYLISGQRAQSMAPPQNCEELSVTS